MNKQEVIFKLKDKIDDIEGFLSWEHKEKKIAINQLRFAIDTVDQLDEPEIAEEKGFLGHLTCLFKKHGYDHLGQVALALENNLEISINKELPAIPQFVANWFEVNKYSLEENVYILLSNAESEGVKRPIETWALDKNNKPIETLIRMKDGYTIEKEPHWVVRFEASKFYRNLGKEVSYFIEFVKDGDIKIKPNGVNNKNHGAVYKFTDKQKADAVAVLIDGTVEEL